MYVDAMVFEANMDRRKEYYIASELSILCENNGNKLKYSYIDFIDDNLPEEDTRTGEDIANEIIARHNLKVKG